MYTDHVSGLYMHMEPNGYARNKIERAMSFLNVPLAHTALKRADMPEWAGENKVKNASSMSKVCDVTDALTNGVSRRCRKLNPLSNVQPLQKQFVPVLTPLRVLMNKFFIKQLMLPLPVFFIIVNLLLLLVLQVMLLGRWKVRTVSPSLGTPPYHCQFKLRTI